MDLGYIAPCPVCGGEIKLYSHCGKPDCKAVCQSCKKGFPFHANLYAPMSLKRTVPNMVFFMSFHLTPNLSFTVADKVLCRERQIIVSAVLQITGDNSRTHTDTSISRCLHML